MADSTFLSVMDMNETRSPRTFFDYYVATQHLKNPPDFLCLRTRDGFLKQLKSDSRFSRFFTELRDRFPESQAYFASLVNDRVVFDSWFVQLEYEKFLRQNEFNALRADVRRAFEVDYINLRKKKYLHYLQTWSSWFGCDLPNIHLDMYIPQLGDTNQGLKLECVLNDVVPGILKYLDAMDIFRMSLVCKKWKTVILQNTAALKQAEYKAGSFLVDSSSWHDDFESFLESELRRKYFIRSQGLIQWCCNVSQNLEILVVYNVMEFQSLFALLQRCPKLKRLQLSGSTIYKPKKKSSINLETNVRLPDLEVFTSVGSNSVQYDSLVNQILQSTTKLQAVQYPSLSKKVINDSLFACIGICMRNLVALELTCSTLHILKALTKVEDFKLKYFGVGKDPSNKLHIMASLKYKTMEKYFMQILPKMRYLEILKLEDPPGLTKSIFQLIIRLQLDLKAAYLCENSWSTCFNEETDRFEYDFSQGLDKETILRFREMLLKQNPNVHLSDFFFVPTDRCGVERGFEAMGSGFTFYHHFHYTGRNPVGRFSLTDADLRKQIGIQL